SASRDRERRADKCYWQPAPECVTLTAMAVHGPAPRRASWLSPKEAAVKGTHSEFLREARRCAYEASKGVSPGRSQMFTRLAPFYTSLAESDPKPEPRAPRHRVTEKHRVG